MPVPVNLTPIESSISILENVKTHIQKDSYEEVEWAANYVRALTLKARAAGVLESLWSADSAEVESEEAALSLESVANFLDKNW